MLHLKARDLTWTGWLVAALSMALGVLVCIPIGRCVVDAVDRTFFRAWKHPLCFLMALPGIALAMLTFHLSSRFLRRPGIFLVRARESAPNKA